MPFYHLNSTLLDVGSVIMPGNWGRIIRRIGPNHGRWVIETAMEELRQREFPNRPSRLTSAFVLDSLDEANFYRDVDQSRSIMCLYRVEFVDPQATSFTTDWRNVLPDHQLNMDWARRYWNGEMLPLHQSGRACREVLTGSALRVMEVVQA